MKFKKISMNIPNETYIELNREANVLGVPLSSLILIKLNELKKQQESKDLLTELLSNNQIKNLIELYNNNKNE
ncbi:hypothetical protein II654_01095 [bacterium]|nr:hypothetical protein [bacterium]